MTPTNHFVQVVAPSTTTGRWKNHVIGYFIRPTGCWEWGGHIRHDGYGELRVDGQKLLAHRYLFEMERGVIAADLTLDHLCRNHRCVNPDHLEPVSNRVNILRGESPAARQARQTHCAKGHELSDDNLDPTNLKLGKRKCRICRNATQLAYHYRKRARLLSGIPFD